MPTSDALPDLLKDRESAQAEVSEATDEIKLAQAKLAEATKALAEVNRKIAAELGINSAPRSRATSGQTNHERVLEVLKAADAPMARKKIAAELDAEPNSVGAALAYLKKNGKAKQDGVKAAAVWSVA